MNGRNMIMEPGSVKFRPSSAIFAAILLTFACTTTNGSFPSDAEAVSAFDTPEEFTAPSVAGTPDGSCLVRLYDPRDRGEIRLVRSVGPTAEQPPRGDYEVPDGKYGVNRRELLRIDCSTGRPIGIVRR